MAEAVVNIIAVGDIFLGEHPVTLGHGVNSIVKQRGCDFLFAKIKDHLRGGDIVCGNLEGIISPRKKTETGIKSAIFWGDPVCAQTLKSCGFNCLFLANNHNAQHGKDALKRTCSLLDEHGIRWTGFNPDDPASPIPAIFQVRGLKVAVLSYCESQQYNLHTPILPLANFDYIKRDVDRIRKDCDVIILSLHWGDEFIDYPSPRQVLLAHKILDWGVHLLLGHHSHTMQGVQRYRDGLVAYSLGSFVKDLWPRKLRESAILKCQLSRNGINKFSMIPIFINNQYQPEIYWGEPGKQFLKRVEVLSKKIEHYDLIDFRYREKEYVNDVKRLLFKDRLETLFHYMLNLSTYHPRLLLDNIVLMVKRRLDRENI